MGLPIIRISAALVLVFGVFLSSCYYDSNEELYPRSSNGCDTAAISYSKHVAPVMVANCVSCHNAGLKQGGVQLDNYAGVKATVDNARLLGSIRWQSGFVAMPQGGSQLSQCNITKIQAWINANMPNN